METTYRLNAKDLTGDLIKSIQEAFKDKDIEITVSEQIDETSYLLASKANENQLYQAIEDLENGRGVPMTVAELQAKYLK